MMSLQWAWPEHSWNEGNEAMKPAIALIHFNQSKSLPPTAAKELNIVQKPLITTIARTPKSKRSRFARASQAEPILDKTTANIDVSLAACEAFLKNSDLIPFNQYLYPKILKTKMYFNGNLKTKY